MKRWPTEPVHPRTPVGEEVLAVSQCVFWGIGGSHTALLLYLGGHGERKEGLDGGVGGGVGEEVEGGRGGAMAVERTVVCGLVGVPSSLGWPADRPES